MNPPGKWIETGHGTLFQSDEIAALYGLVQYKVRSGFPWRWEARTLLDAREITAPPVTGYAPTKEGAMEIVECILRNTDTCKFSVSDIGEDG